MNAMQDILNIERGAETEEEYYRSVQRAINSGLGWSMQGAIGRTMMQAISDGRCMLGKNPAHDYWGNFIPSRDMVEDGSIGSYSFVADQFGSEWADMIATA